METSQNLSALTTQYYVIARKWASDLEFFKIENSFLHRLLEDHFIKMTTPEYIERLKHIGKQMYELDNDISRADTQVDRQLKKMELMAENVIPESPDELTDIQNSLDGLITKITDEYRALKRELFETISSLISNRQMLN